MLQRGRDKGIWKRERGVVKQKEEDIKTKTNPERQGIEKEGD